MSYWNHADVIAAYFQSPNRLEGSYSRNVHLACGIIDAVCAQEKENDMVVLEFKTNLDKKALGQLLIYQYYFSYQYRIAISRVKMACVYHSEDPVLTPVFLANGIMLLQV